MTSEYLLIGSHSASINQLNSANCNLEWLQTYKAGLRVGPLSLPGFGMLMKSWQVMIMRWHCGIHINQVSCYGTHVCHICICGRELPYNICKLTYRLMGTCWVLHMLFDSSKYLLYSDAIFQVFAWIQLFLIIWQTWQVFYLTQSVGIWWENILSIGVGGNFRFLGTLGTS